MLSAFRNAAGFTQQLSGAGKTIHLTDPSLDVTVVGNFDVVPTAVNPAFQRVGKWYDYLRGDSVTVTNATAVLALAPGEYRVYTSRRLTRPAGTVLAARSSRAGAVLRLGLAPNPASGTTSLHYELPAPANVRVTVTNLLGATVYAPAPADRQLAGPHELALPVSGWAPGVYLVRLSTGTDQQTTRLVVQP